MKTEIAVDALNQNFRILAADDDQMTLDLYRDILAGFGDQAGRSYELVACLNGLEAIEAIDASLKAEDPFAVAFLDVRMSPGPDGVRTAALIRQLDPVVEVVMVTGYSDLDPVEIARQVGRPEKLLYLQKPFHPLEIQQFTRSLATKWQAERQVREAYRHLEAQVEERTAELAKANRQLRRDVAERERTQAALRRSQERYRQLVENINEIILTLDDKGVVTYISPVVERLMGHRVEDVVGRPFSRLICPDDEEILRRTLAGAPEPQELRVLDGEGGLRLASLSGRVISDGGRPAGLTAVLTDLTELKRWESQQRLAAKVLENSIEGIIVTDERGVIEMVNPAFTSITGYNTEEALGQNGLEASFNEEGGEISREIMESLASTGQWRGEAWSRRKGGEAYPAWRTISAIKDDRGQVSHYVIVFHDISEIKRRHDEIKYKAYHDALTGLPNRLLLEDRLKVALAHAQRSRSQIAVLFLDIDRFKDVNDGYGHGVGDQLLQEAARRLSQALRQEDTVSRLGGDEFLIVVEKVKSAEDALAVACKLGQMFAQPFEIQGRPVVVTASIGVSIFPEHGQDPRSLILKADKAMYRAKELGRDRCQMYED